MRINAVEKGTAYVELTREDVEALERVLHLRAENGHEQPTPEWIRETQLWSRFATVLRMQRESTEALTG